MIVRAMVAALLVTAAFSASAQKSPPGAPTKECKKSDPACQIAVTVPAPCSACTPAVDHLLVAIEKGNKNQITWSIGTPGYAFDKTKGIDFTDDPNGDEFKCHAQQNAAIYVCTNKHSTSGKTYKYTVNVTGPGPRCRSIRGWSTGKRHPHSRPAG